MSGKCLFFWQHEWDKWDVIDQGSVMHAPTFREGEEYKVGKFIVQQRSCKKCGKTQVNTQKS